MTEHSVFDSQQRPTIFLFSKTHRPAEGSTQPKSTGNSGGQTTEAWSRPPVISAKVENDWSATSTPSYDFDAWSLRLLCLSFHWRAKVGRMMMMIRDLSRVVDLLPQQAWEIKCFITTPPPPPAQAPRNMIFPICTSPVHVEQQFRAPVMVVDCVRQWRNCKPATLRSVLLVMLVDTFWHGSGACLYIQQRRRTGQISPKRQTARRHIVRLCGNHSISDVGRISWRCKLPWVTRNRWQPAVTLLKVPWSFSDLCNSVNLDLCLGGFLQTGAHPEFCGEGGWGWM